MCSGAELATAAQIAATAYGAYTVYQTAHKPLPSAPPINKQDPVADDTQSQTDAAQEAQRQTLLARERARKNSLLSLAGGAGDTSQPVLGRPEGKATFGGS